MALEEVDSEARILSSIAGFDKILESVPVASSSTGFPKWRIQLLTVEAHALTETNLPLCDTVARLEGSQKL
jgi:hypothetical protein